MSEAEAIYVDGIGAIAQYHSYVEQYWTHGIPYFVRDCMLHAISQEKCRLQYADINKIESLAKDVECMNKIIYNNFYNPENDA